MNKHKYFADRLHKTMKVREQEMTRTDNIVCASMFLKWVKQVNSPVNSLENLANLLTNQN